jgi:hypothetical protein
MLPSNITCRTILCLMSISKVEWNVDNFIILYSLFITFTTILLELFRLNYSSIRHMIKRYCTEKIEQALALRKLSKDDDFGTYSDMSAAKHCCLLSQSQPLAVLCLFLAVVQRRCLRCFLLALFALLRAFATSSMRICIHGNYVVAHVALSHATPSRRLCIFVTDARDAMSRHE